MSKKSKIYQLEVAGPLKAMNQLDRVVSAIAIVVCNVIQKLITLTKELKRFIWYQKSTLLNNFGITLHTVIAINDLMWF